MAEWNGACWVLDVLHQPFLTRTNRSIHSVESVETRKRTHIQQIRHQRIRRSAEFIMLHRRALENRHQQAIQLQLNPHLPHNFVHGFHLLPEHEDVVEGGRVGEELRGSSAEDGGNEWFA